QISKAKLITISFLQKLIKSNKTKQQEKQMRTLLKFVAVAALVSTLLVVSFRDQINLRNPDLPDCCYIQNDYGYNYVRNICEQSMMFHLKLKNIKTGRIQSIDTECMFQPIASFDIPEDKFEIVEITQQAC
ncbi:transmembrane protein, putative, partial (macronuclear) [Tetrahymena thermophila SB210]